MPRILWSQIVRVNEGRRQVVMAHSTVSFAADEPGFQGSLNRDATASAVSWGAVIGGAFVAAALGLILLALGAGIGLSSISPWASAGASASTVGWGAIVWLILVQIIASTIGGYLAG